MTYAETIDWLFAQLPMYQRVGQVAYKADLSNTHKLMELLEHPERGFQSIHVAGTNGKGSVSHMLAAIYQQAGYKTGLYTSPHLKDFRERIRINGQMIPEEKVIDFVTANKEHFIQIGVSFFEMTVGLAFQNFAQEEVDIAIIEVGMGGRLDSTNVITPRLSIITNISLDHTQFLGPNLATIAAEKAGIIKPQAPVLVGERQAETTPVFERISSKQGAKLYFSDDLPFKQTVKTDLIGSYQQKNLQTVLAAIRLLEKQGDKLSPFVEDALADVKKLTGLHGRWDVLQKSPRVIADTGHNIAGVAELVRQLAQQEFHNLHMVWGMVNDKDTYSVLELLPKDAAYYFCTPNIPRGKDSKQLELEAHQIGLKGEAYPTVAEAYQTAKDAAQANDLIFVGGSTFVVAEILP